MYQEEYGYGRYKNEHKKDEPKLNPVAYKPIQEIVGQPMTEEQRKRSKEAMGKHLEDIMKMINKSPYRSY